MKNVVLSGSVLFALVICLIGCNGSVQKSKSESVNQILNQVSEVNDDAGKLVYIRNCKVCHQGNGKGVPGVYPPIVNTERMKGDKEYLVRVVLDGLNGKVQIEGKTYNGVMASYRNLSDEQIANVLNYLRNKSENDLPVILPEEVKKYR